MTDTLTNIPPTEISPVTSENDTSPTILGREVGVRDLRPGDVIGLAGRVEIARVTAELAPDLTPWWAVRLTGGTIIPASDDSTFELITTPHRARSVADAPGDIESFVAPRAMAKLIELANHHRRSYMVGHRCDHYDGKPSVSLTVLWYPHDCDIQTALYLDWHNTTSPGRYRLRSASARGYLENHRALTIAEAERLITGANCFFHGETSPPSPPS